MSLKELYHNKWARFGFWAVLYILWVIWLGNYWWLFGLVPIFDYHITRKVKWLFWKKEYKEGEKHNALLDWLDAIIFAVVVVTFINTFFFQAFKIPSSSMESSLYTGDHLFVSKLAYGPKLPQTPLTIPFTHNVIGGKESYSTLIQSDYRRLKGFGKVKTGDYVVFGFPHGDTILTKAPADDYYMAVRTIGREQVIRQYGPLKVRPADKKDHYVKRCVAVAGDTLEIRDGQVYVNGIAQENWPGVQNSYKVVTNGQRINPVVLDKIGLNTGELGYHSGLPGYPQMPLTAEMLKSVEKLPNVVSVDQNVDVYPPDYPDSFMTIFPFSPSYEWTRDNFGPLWIPKKGVEVELSEENLPLYERIITAYEGNTLNVKNGTIYINGEEAHTYTFRQDYYFMMGDNRHNSLDSRYWGFVPEDHIVGKPALIWLSIDGNKKFPKNIRWRRFFKFV
ncbi:MAG: signal peptidase I [Bacteroidales bacterium]|nr:signal peptidase I [Bacteroidales bacterium]